jgi:hypothetical protein
VAALLGVCGSVCLAAGLTFRRAHTIAPALALVGGEYALLVAIDADAIDLRAPLVAACLFVAGELAAWSLELRAAVADEAGIWWRRVAAVLLEATGAYVVAAAVLAVADAGVDGGIPLEAVGAAALAAGALALARLASRG